MPLHFRSLSGLLHFRSLSGFVPPEVLRVHRFPRWFASSTGGQSKASSTVQDRVLSLIDNFGVKGELSTGDLAAIYKKQFQEKIDYSGHRKLGKYLATFPDVHFYSRNSNGYVSRSAKGKGGQDFNPEDSNCDMLHAVSTKCERNDKIELVRSLSHLEKLRSTFPFDTSVNPPFQSSRNDEKAVVAVDCKGVPENLFLVQVAASEDHVYIFDGLELGEQEVCDFLLKLLNDASIIKLMHNLHKDAMAFARYGVHLAGTLDTQLAIEASTGAIHCGLNEMLQGFGLETNTRKAALGKRGIDGGRGFSKRPISEDLLHYAADNVRLLIKAEGKVREALGSDWAAVQRASDHRADGVQSLKEAERLSCFDRANNNQVASYILLNELRPEDVCLPGAIDIETEIDSLLELLPVDIQEEITPCKIDLSEIQLDVGRHPLAWFGKERKEVGCDRIITSDEIEMIVAKIGRFGSDNRATMDGCLHRISAVRNLQDKIIGLTIRVGRYIIGITDVIMDLLSAETRPSILFLGEPGSSKTTIVREVARKLASELSVCVVDTSNEIAGDGDIPHHCIGKARRMMVPSLNAQKAVMIECVQNHTPQVMVIDEIGRISEVKAAQTCRTRGVQLIASAHGSSLRQLVDNPELNGLIGGVEQVVLGDIEAKTRDGNKVARQRAEPPVFDVVIEVKRDEMRVVADSSEAVDNILNGNKYLTQLRKRNPFRVVIETIECAH